MKTVGILGGGQLGLMLAQAALPLGIRCIFLEDAPNCPASALGKVYPTKNFDKFKNSADVFTLEFENTPVDTACALEEKGLYPSTQALSIAQDRLKEKNTFVQLGINTVPFLAVHTQAELETAVTTLGLPIVLKTTRGGYDGKGQVMIKSPADVATAWQTLGQNAPLIAEGFIDFEKEVSIIAVRAKNGDVVTYPLIENHHHHGILSHSIAPASQAKQILDDQTATQLADNLEQQAQSAIKKLLAHFDYVGVLTLELFVTKDGLLANEIAPRVHNSGHWSIEGAVCSQFENHMRAVVGLPLGNTDIVKPSVMVNIIGQYPDTDAILALDAVHLHHYGKAERVDRKIGHLTLMPNHTDAILPTLQKIASTLPNPMGLTSCNG